MKSQLFASLSLALCLIGWTSLSAQTPAAECQIHKYTPTDGGIFWGINHNGDWATIRVGSESAGGTATPKLYNVATDDAFEVRYQNRIIEVNSVTDDGNIVVGSWSGRAVAYFRDTNRLVTFPSRSDWSRATLTSVTPDGHYAVGYYNGYESEFGMADDEVELTGDYYFSPLMVDIEAGDTLALPGLPQLDMAHLDQHAQVFDAITPDGRYAIGRMDWYILQPLSGFTFIYDTQLHTYRVVGFTEHEHADWTSLFPYMHHVESAVLSPDGHWLAGEAYMTLPQEGSEFFNEYSVPFRYDINTSELTVFDQGDSHNVSVGAVANDGTIFGNPESGSPLRNFRIFFQDRYWLSFAQICRQYYGFDFQERTGFEYTGTVMGVSDDARRIVSFSDPTGESYLFDFGRPVSEVCAAIDLLDSYTVFPEPNATFALLSNVEINFGRSVQVLGDGSNVHLYKADGTLVSNGLSTRGLTLKTGSKNTVVAAFRTRPLEADTDYYVVIDAGAVAVNGDSERTNSEIRIPYHGRDNGPVRLVKATPATGSALRQIDNANSYILLEFDAEVRTTEAAEAKLLRVNDGSVVTSLNVVAGTIDATRRSLLITPNTPYYLYAGEEYQLVLEAGSISDYTEAASSYNERIEINYIGTYVREETSERVMFADDFNDYTASLRAWLLYDGDHRTPTNNMQAWSFNAQSTPWIFSARDDEASTDAFAASHSQYSPAGTSDDWMITPQLSIPYDGKAVLEFDAQSYDPNRHDALTLRIYEDRKVLSYLNDDLMQTIRSRSVLLDSIMLTAGAEKELTAGEWTHYSYDLSPWAGKDIYVAFVNQNTSQSAVFVDNVIVQREVLFSLGFSNRDRVVAMPQIGIAGQFTLLTEVPGDGSTSLTLRDGQGHELSKVTWNDIPTKGQPRPFSFASPLPLEVGAEVPYFIDVQVGNQLEQFCGTIQNLAFQPVKRVVLEEMTGSTCINCPLGIVSVEHCEEAFGDRFIPIGIHTYTGDNLGAGLFDYTDFLGLPGAPMARINRLPDVYSPMYRLGDEFYYRDVEGEPLWYDVVSRELDRLTIAELDLRASLSAADERIVYTADLRYALTANNQQLSLLIVLLEDGLVSFQQNGFSSATSVNLGEWCNGGLNAKYTVYPYTHDHVARAVVGQTFGGTIGLFPSSLEGGVTYSASVYSACPAAIKDINRLSAVAMLIDSQTGEVINATKVAVTVDEGEGIQIVGADATDEVIYDLQGRRIQSLQPGFNVVNGRKVIIR